jgi:hypothetical protein
MFTQHDYYFAPTQMTLTMHGKIKTVLPTFGMISKIKKDLPNGQPRDSKSKI